MAQLTALISTTDPEFRAHVTKCLRASGTSVAVIDDRHASVNPPSLTIVDIRHGAKGIDGIERLRASCPTATIFAIASTTQPEQILQAMRAGANEYLSWPIDESFNAAIHRAAERSRPKEGSRNSCVLSFFGVKGGAGTTTVAVNTAIEIVRISKKPTLIIDLHQFIGEVALFLGVRPRFTLVDALDNLHRIDTEFLRELVVKHKTGLDILAGGEQAERPGPQDAAIFEQLLQTLGRSYDYIIIDGGLVTGPCSDIAVFAADSIYLVGNPDIASVRNAHRVVDRMGQLGANKDRIRMLLNRMSDQHEIGPKHIEQTLGFSLFSVFSSDYSTVSAALNSGVPLTLSNHSELAAQFATFTRQIVFPDQTAAGADQPRARTSFMGLF
jgi:pilus assembly protein CpaE